MRLSAPTKNVFYISVIIAVLGFVGNFTTISFVSDNVFWFLVVGYLLLVAGTTMKGV